MGFIRIDKTTREEWLDWRHTGIGSSDVPAIMGVSRYKTREELLKEKLSITSVENKTNEYIKTRGNKIESIVRELYESYMGIKFPATSCQSTERTYALATLDGIDEKSNLIIEIKLLTTQKSYMINKSTEGYKKWIAAKNGKIPIDYYPQIQHQLSVTGISACVFLGFMEVRGKTANIEDVAIATILPNTEYIEDMNTQIEMFWNEVTRSKNDKNSKKP